MAGKYVRMWAEENHNYYDLLHIVRNYGPRMIFGISAKEAIAYSKDFYAEFYLSESELVKFGDKGYDFYVNQNGLDQLSYRVQKAIDATNLGMRRLITLDLSRLTDKELFQEYLKYVGPFGDLMALYVVTQPHFVAKIEKDLASKLSKLPNQDELFNVLTSPSADFVFSEEGKFFEKSFAELLRHEDAELDLSIIDKPLYEVKASDPAKKDHLIRENNLSDEIVKVADILGNIAQIRLKMRFVWMPAIYFFELFLIELKRRHGISKRNIRMYDAEELDELISSSVIVDNKILEERSVGFAKFLKDGEIKTLSGEEANKFILSINKIEDNIIEIKGTIASKGFARGKVIVLSYTKSSEHTEKIRNMSDGDILVSEMTRPNIIIACKKAGAIITDEGGITSHAAIVSRELKKPCIIGTKIATQVLKDGDLVEVDANIGLVRKVG